MQRETTLQTPASVKKEELLSVGSLRRISSGRTASHGRMFEQEKGVRRNE